MTKYVFMAAMAIALLSTPRAGAEEVATIECTFTNDGTIFTRVWVIDTDKGWDVTSGMFTKIGVNTNNKRLIASISRWTGAAALMALGVGSINGNCENTKMEKRDRQLF